MAEVTVGEETLHVELEGDETKPVILLSNALGTNLSMWDAQMPALLEHYRVLRYDSRGHGDSSVPEGPYTINLLGQDALAILDALGLEQVDFIGLSLGGFIGQWLLLHAPERIGKAILSNTASQIGNEEMWADRIQTAFHDGMTPIANGLIEAWFTREVREKNPEAVSRIEKMILATPTEGYTATCAALRDADLRDEITNIKAPVLVIVGRHDIVTPTGIGALIASAIDGAKLVTLDAAHLSNVGAPDEFNKEALAFLVDEGTSAAQEEPAMAEDDDVISADTTEVLPEPQAEAKPKAPRKPRVKKAPVEAPAAEEAAPEPEVLEMAAAAEDEALEEALTPAEPVVLAPKPKKPRAKKAPKPVEAALEPDMVAMPIDDDPPGENAEAEDFAEPAPAPKRRAPVKKAAAKKTAAKKAPAKKAAAKKTAVKKAVAKKAPAKKAAVKKAAVKKAAVKKAAVKKAPAKKAAVKKAATKKTAAKKAPVKKTAVKKTAVKSTARKAVGKTRPVKKIAVKKAAVKKTAVKKAVPKKGAIKVAAKKTAIKKAAVKKSAVKKTAVKKSAVKKAPAKKTAVKKTAVKKTALRAAPKKAMKKAPARKGAAKKAKRG